MLLFGCGLVGQTGPTATPPQAPRTAPQVKEILPSYEGQKVTSVELAGQPQLDTRKLVPLLAQRANEPFERAKVEQSIAALRRAGFQAVTLEVRPEADGIRVLFILQPATYFGIYQFPGATQRFPYSRLLQVADYPPRGAYTPVDVQNASDAMQTFFRRNGHFQARVEPQVVTDEAHGVANVIFHTNLNRRAKFGELKITGVSGEEAESLQGALKSLMARVRGAAIRPGKTYSLKTLQNATRYLQGRLMKRDRLDARVELAGANYDPATNRADIEFRIQPGPLIHVQVEGAHLWPWTRRKLIPLYQQVGTSPEIIQEGRQNLLSHFQSKGYFQAQVDLKVEQQPGAETVLYRVTKGPRHKVAEVTVAGNQHLPETDLKPAVVTRKGNFLSHGKYSEKLVRTTVKNLKSIYEAEGFSEVKVTPQVTWHGQNLVVTYHIEEGPQDIVESLRFEGNESQSPSQLAPQGLKLAPGQPYSQKRADEDRNQIIATYLRLGYLNASFREAVRRSGQDKRRLEVVYQIQEGPRIHTASVVTLGRSHTKQSLIDRTTKLKIGEPLREDQMLASETRLYTLGVFDWAEIDPRRQVTTQTQEDVLIKVHEAKRNTITYGFGFEVINRGGSVPSGTVALPGLPPVGLPSTFKTSEKTFWGPRGSFEYARKNMRGRAETLTLSGLAGRLVQRGSVTYADPGFRGSVWEATYHLRGERNAENPIFSSRLGEVGFQLQRPLNAKRTRTLMLRYSYRQTGLVHLLIPELVAPEDRHIRLSTLSATYSRDTRDNLLDAHKGIYQSFQIDLNPTALGSSVNFVRFLGQTAYYRTIPAGIVWASSLRLGLEQPFAGSHVPISEKFFSGGGSTLRGFPLNGAGPQRTIPACGDPADPSTCSFIQVPVGGNQLLILNSELRVPVPLKKGLGVVGFYDGGNVYPRIGFHDFGANYTNTIGIGLRYVTPVGPIRVDVGHNLNALPGIKATQIFITLGQAF